jgi:hypothetical protein
MTYEPQRHAIRQSEAVSLLSLFAEEVNRELHLIYNYSNFFVAVMTTILGVTIAALFNKDLRPQALPWLLLGPGLVMALSALGWANVRIFYDRFLEAWIARLNLEHALSLRANTAFAERTVKLKYENKLHGLLPFSSDKKLHAILETEKDAAKLMDELRLILDSKSALWAAKLADINGLALSFPSR